MEEATFLSYNSERDHNSDNGGQCLGKENTCSLYQLLSKLCVKGATVQQPGYWYQGMSACWYSYVPKVVKGPCSLQKGCYWPWIMMFVPEKANIDIPMPQLPAHGPFTPFTLALFAQGQVRRLAAS